MILHTLAVLLFTQLPAELDPDQQTLSRALYFESLGASGADLCGLTAQSRQRRIFERRYGKRIAALKRYYYSVHGPDPDFAIVLTCRRDTAEARRLLNKGMDGFESRLRKLEQRYGPKE
jgi:hypothetical protein